MIRDLQFSVVIPTKDRLDDLTLCIQSILEQTKKPKEVIVVDGGSYPIEERICEICLQGGLPIKYIKQIEGRFGRAKNLGVKEAEGDIVLFVDDDVVLDRGYVEWLAQVYQEDTMCLIGGVKGICSNITRHHPIKEAFCLLFILGGHSKNKTHLLPSGTCYVPISLPNIKKTGAFMGPAHSYRKFVFNEFQFDEDFEEGDELNFSIRVSRKYNLYTTPYARFIHNQKLGIRNIIADQTMDTYTRYYLFRKLMPQKLKNKLCFFWSQIGWLLGYVGFCLIRPTKRNRDYAKGSIKGTMLILRNIIRGKYVP